MKKFKDFLLKSRGILKVLLFFLFLFWSCQLVWPIRESMKENIKTYKEWNYNEARESMQEFYAFRNELYEKAKEKGEDYDFFMYLTDLAAVEKKGEELKTNENPFFSNQSLQSEFFELVRKNIIVNRISQKEITDARERFEKENGELFFKQKEITFDWKKVPPFLITLYLRTIWLVSFLYLIRLSERTNSTILGIILGDKKKFCLAILLWPIYFLKYPHNVIREIRIEAELRRLKGLFGKFSLKERKLVREIASSGYYKKWLTEFNTQYKGSFQSGLFLAVIVTIFIHLLFSFSIQSSEKKSKDPSLFFCSLESQIIIGQEITEDTVEENYQTEYLGISPKTQLPDFPPIIIFVTFLKEVVQSKELGNIDHIPLIDLFGELIKTINQIRKGIRNEYGPKNNLFDRYVNWGSRSCFQ